MEILDTIETRYQQSTPSVFTSSLPWIPQCSLLEGMLIINTTPLGCHKNLREYADFIIRRFILSQLQRGTNEVHIIFDNPTQNLNTPKQFEQSRRDQSSTVPTSHCCDDLQGHTLIPSGKWRENFLNCRICKRNLVKYLGTYILRHITTHLKPTQTVYVAGDRDDGTAWYVTGKQTAQPEPKFSCNAEETDTRIWLHASKTTANRILVVSCDTDVYNIGLPLQCTKQKQIVVQVSKQNSSITKILHMSALTSALTRDPDLAGTNSDILSKVMQTLYVTTGCDYISFFSQIGKATFLRYFFQYTSFITSGTNDTPGTLADTTMDSESNNLGFLAYIRLIGVTYFKKYASCFEDESPVTYFQKVKDSSLPPYQQHASWLHHIRETIWDRIAFENQMVPSVDALRLHWERSCWVMHMWQQACNQRMSLLPLTSHGWMIEDNSLAIVWDTQQNMEAVHDRVALLTQGCKCKKSECTTRQCKCVKNNTSCSEGCQCLNCKNTATTTTLTLRDSEYAANREDSPSDSSEDEQLDSDQELMDHIFGTDSTYRYESYDDEDDDNVHDSSEDYL